LYFSNISLRYSYGKSAFLGEILNKSKSTAYPELLLVLDILLTGGDENEQR